jgi:hypothetical protein
MKIIGNLIRHAVGEVPEDGAPLHLDIDQGHDEGERHGVGPNDASGHVCFPEPYFVRKNTSPRKTVGDGKNLFVEHPITALDLVLPDELHLREASRSHLSISARRTHHIDVRGIENKEWWTNVDE